MLTLNNFKKALEITDQLRFKLPNGTAVPAHFHITEAGLIRKNFIDCGGTVREEAAVTMQLWSSDDYDHRLNSKKVLSIIEKAEALFVDEELPVEIEYQSDTIGKYHIEFNGADFQLIPTETDCLAKEKCGVTPAVKTSNPVEVVQQANGCTPGSGCC